MQLNQNLSFVLFVVAAVAGGCDRAKPEITKRYALAMNEKLGVCKEDRDNGEEPLVTGSVFALENRPSKTTILDLSPNGQAALIEAVGAAKKETTAEELRGQVGAPLGLPTNSSVAPDRTRFTRTVVVSLASHPQGAADRISDRKWRRYHAKRVARRVRPLMAKFFEVCDSSHKIVGTWCCGKVNAAEFLQTVKNHVAMHTPLLSNEHRTRSRV
jgi:hypothetical protein